MTAAILIVGDDPALLGTRADLLKAWQVSTTSSRQAAEEIRSRAYDLIILCQTIPDETAQTLIHLAREMNPAVKAVAIHVSGQERNVDAELYEIQLQNPGYFPDVVGRLMQPSKFHFAHEEVVKRP
jgi:DNA-binding response OmpR family regulator